ncbi:hypothetical protein L195_g044273 [Trifolium pratense]|uniref:Uncharacterized protein n=1 Tax=Trifolium pratense TaxID=57577 RepID=A0A2K3MBL6_TRIPR|nr:hypothetical protein L195_g044273 [Trifolium pratense]
MLLHMHRCTSRRSNPEPDGCWSKLVILYFWYARLARMKARFATPLFFAFIWQALSARLVREWPFSEGFSLCPWLVSARFDTGNFRFCLDVMSPCLA